MAENREMEQKAYMTSIGKSSAMVQSPVTTLCEMEEAIAIRVQTFSNIH